MNEKLFHAHKDTHNPNNPYPDFVRQVAKRTKVPIELLTRKRYYGKSANGKATTTISWTNRFSKRRARQLSASQKKSILNFNACSPKPQPYKAIWTTNKP